jgi:hypothetical protein
MKLQDIDLKQPEQIFTTILASGIVHGIIEDKNFTEPVDIQDINKKRSSHANRKTALTKSKQQSHKPNAI